MQRFVFGVVALLVGCTASVRDEAFSFCAPFCECIEIPLPSAQRSCNSSCRLAFQRTPLSEDCTLCVIDHADRCTTLIEDCNPVCSQTVPLELIGH